MRLSIRLNAAATAICARTIRRRPAEGTYVVAAGEVRWCVRRDEPLRPESSSVADLPEPGGPVISSAYTRCD